MADFDDLCEQFKVTSAERRELWLFLAYFRLRKMLNDKRAK